MFGFLKRHLETIIRTVSFGFLMLLVGAVLVYNNLPPKDQIRLVTKTLKDARRDILTMTGAAPVAHLETLRFDRTGAHVPAPGKTAPGLRFLVSVFDDAFTARLYDATGALIHHWPVDFFDLPFEGKSHRYHALIHGAHLYPDGSFIANLDGRGVVKVSRCGDIIWRNQGRAHHSIDVDEAGRIWAPVLTDPTLAQSVAAVPVRFDAIAAFDPDTGETLVHIDLLQMIVDAGYEGLVTPNRMDLDDVLHVNDVEILDSAMADDFPLFDAGDIMVNPRNPNQIWILDGQTHKLKWWMTTPAKGAHDPDFQPGGVITILDNRPNGQSEAATGWLGLMGGSRILEIDPVTRASRTLFSSNASTGFYTPFRGKHQMLESGNILIAETDAGRAFEVTAAGDLTWQYVNAFNEDEVAWMMDAIRVPESYRAAFAEPCGG